MKSVANTKNILSKLMELDLSTYPITEIQSLLHELDEIISLPMFRVTKNAPITIMRSRKGHGHNNYKDLTLPSNVNNTQRANTRNNPKFYGSFTSMDNVLARMVNSVEVLELLRDEKSIELKGKEKITFGRWHSTEQLKLFAIIDYYNYPKREKVEGVGVDDAICDLRVHFTKFYHSEKKSKSHLLTNF